MPDKSEFDVKSGLTPAWALFSFLIGSMLALPIGLVVVVDGSYDLLRYVVSAQIFLMIVLYFYSMFVEISNVLGSKAVVVVARTIWFGRITRYAGLIVLLSADIIGIVDRIGEDTLNPLTPASQLAVVILLISWNLLDRRPVVQPITEGVRVN